MNAVSVSPMLSVSGQFSRTGLNLPDDLPVSEWMELGDRLRSMEQSVWWWIGDWLRFGERKYGEMYTQAIAVTGATYSQLTDAKYLAKSYEFSERLENLSWAHHYAAAKLKSDERRQFLAKASESGWSVRDLKSEITRYLVGSDRVTMPCQPYSMGQTAKRMTRLVLAAFCDWFGVCEEYGRVLMVLFEASGNPLTWQEVSRGVSTHAPMNRGALHEAISSLREVMEAESIDRSEQGYFLSEIGFAECRKAFREMGNQLASLGVEPANDHVFSRSAEKVEPSLTV